MNKEQMRRIENNSGNGRFQLNSTDSYFKYNDRNTQINSHVRLVKKFETQLNIVYRKSTVILIQTYFRDIVGLVPDHCNKFVTIKWVTQIFLVSQCM